MEDTLTVRHIDHGCYSNAEVASIVSSQCELADWYTSVCNQRLSLDGSVVTLGFIGGILISLLLRWYLN